MKKKIQKLISVLLSGAMAAGSMAASNLPMVSAYIVNAAEEGIETLLNIDFEDNSTKGFQTYIEGGDCSLANEDGTLTVNIRKCGDVSYGNQIYLDGIELREGCKYKFSFDVQSSIERRIEYRLQMNGGNYQAYTGEFKAIGPEPQHIEKEFTMKKEKDPAVRLCFNMGKQVDMAEDPGEHEVYLDNIHLTLMDDSGEVIVEEPETPMIVSINQVGYQPEDVKTVVTTSDFSGMEFKINDVETGETVYTAVFGDSVRDKATKSDVCQVDFSELTREGTYTIVVGDLAESPAFTIGDTVYEDLYKASLKMLYYQRCGTELTEEFAGEYAHPACHTTEAVIYGTTETKEVSGGWHDAGDYGRYSVPAAKTIADLLLTYEDNKDQELIASDDIGIPESGNGIPDILDEAKYELDWLLKMQDEETGGVYHKVSGYNFPGTVMPEDETAELVLAPISATSTGDFAAIMAKAAVVYSEIDADFSENCLNAAMKAWEYLENTKSLKGFQNPPEIVTGEYGDGYTKDEVYWAGVELYLSGQILGKETIDLSKVPSDEGPELGWTSMGAYGLYDLAKTELTGEDIEKRAEKAKVTLIRKADDYRSISEKDGYYVTLGTNYYWGSNMGVANSGMILLMAHHFTEDDMYQISAQRQLNYLLGVNGLGISYVSGFGTNAMADPHHRPSQSVGKAVPGMLAGGPNSGLDDPYAKQVLKGVSAPGLCYVDNQQSYSTNEVAIYWNSPLIYLTAGI